MNNEPIESPDPEPEACNRLEELVNTCPRGLLVRLFEEFHGVKSPEVEEVTVRERISILQGWAALGSRDAVESLAGIARDISDFLEDLAGDAPGSAEDDCDDIVDDAQDPWLQSPGWSDNRVLARIAEDMMLLEESPEEELSKTVDELDKNLGEPFLVHTATGMFTAVTDMLLKQEDFAAELEASKAEEDGKGGDEGAGEQPEEDGKPEDDRSGLRNWAANERKVNLILSRLLGKRARCLGRVAARAVLAEAEAWPMVVAAPSVGTATSLDARIARIGLGCGLAHRIPKPKAGQKDIRRWVNSIFLVLDEERVWMATRSAAHRAEFQAVEDAINSGDADARPPLKEWNTSNHWRRKAALLPLLEKGSVGQWANAGMACLRFLASRKEYDSEVRKPLSRERLASLSPLCCPGCGKSLSGECACPIGSEINAESEIKAGRYADLENRLLEKWEQGVAKRFDDYEWPEFITRRTENRMLAPSALREKLKDGFKAMQRTDPQAD